MGNIHTRIMCKSDLLPVYQLVQNAIDISYKSTYPAEAIEFFKNWHSKERILDDVTAGYIIIAENVEILGTGTLFGTNIRRVYVNPSHQYNGLGKQIVKALEIQASIEKATILDLEASLGSKQFWESLGYAVQKEESISVGDAQELRFYKMAKTL